MSDKRALCVVQSWLMSWDVATRIREGRLEVNGVPVQYDVAQVLHPDFNVSMAEMRRVAERCGVAHRPPPREPTCRRAASDDVLARSMRLTAFAKVPNPSPAMMARYMPVVKREADRAHRLFANLNRALLMEAADYLSVGMVFLTIYLHRYQDLEKESRNGADLTLYLQQEFRRLDKVLHKELPSIALDARGMLAEQFVQGPVPGGSVEWWHTWGDAASTREPSYTMPEYVEPAQDDSPDIHQEGNLPHHLLGELLTEEEYATHVKRCPACLHEKKAARDARKRQNAAKLRLTDALDGLPHDRFVETLTEVAANPFLDPEARDLAADLLRKHSAGCGVCHQPVDDAQAQRPEGIGT